MRTGGMPSRPPFTESQPSQSDAGTHKRDLATWWKGFKRGNRKEEVNKSAAPLEETGIFGVPLHTSIRYANVAISLLRINGDSYVYGYVPTVVAKCGVFLKEKATETEGIFRLAGAERRIKELMATFSAPDRYGKGLDWTGYTVHDAANLLRRYLNQLPDPIIPLETYYTFREPLIGHQAEAVGERDLQKPSKGNFDLDGTIRVYKQLITQLPTLNRQLLLYILDLLAVFAAKSDVNMMDASNLSVIFQPGVLRHPDTDLIPEEYRLSQDVLIFLIVNQDHFIVGMEGTEADENTIQEVESASKTPSAPSTPKRRVSMLGRSNSTASAGSENFRRFGSLRRNASTKSRNSNEATSPGTPPASSPFTPGTKSSGVHRSNTVPSKKSPRPSPALSAAERFQPFQGAESPSAGIAGSPSVSSPLSNSVNATLTSTTNQAAAVQKVKEPSASPGDALVAEKSDGTPTHSTFIEAIKKDDGTLPTALPAEPLGAAMSFEQVAAVQKTELTPPNSTGKDHLTVGKRGGQASSSPSRSPLLRPFLGLSSSRTASQDKQRSSIDGAAMDLGLAPGAETPTRERGFSSYFKSSPHSDTEGRSGSKPKKLQKKRPEDILVSKESQQSLSVSGASQPPSPAVVPSTSDATVDQSRKSFTDDSIQTGSARAPSTSDGDDRATSPRRNPVKWFRGKIQEFQEKKEDRTKSRSPRRNSFGMASHPKKEITPTLPEFDAALHDKPFLEPLSNVAIDAHNSEAHGPTTATETHGGDPFGQSILTAPTEQTPAKYASVMEPAVGEPSKTASP